LHAPTAPFSEQLRDGTRGVHQETESAPFVGALMSGAVDARGYAALLGQLHHVYSALEDPHAAVVQDPVLAPFQSAALHRCAALAADLRALLGDDWQGLCPPLPATLRYRDRIAEVAAHWPGGFVAHHYTRYLGDLSGGQALRVAVQRHLDLPDGVGTSFFVFEAIDSPKRFKDHYRRALDTAPWDDEERERIVAEARRAFVHNGELFADLWQHLAGQPSAEVVLP